MVPRPLKGERSIGTAARPARIAQIVALVAVLLVPSMAHGIDSWRIRQLYSNQDGEWQAIELEETEGRDDAHRLAGVELVVTDRHGVSKTLTFPMDLPAAVTARRRVAIVSSELARLAGTRVDYTIPNRFLPTDGGTIRLGTHDSWTYDALPTVYSSLLRDGTSTIDDIIAVTSFRGQLVGMPGGFAIAREFYNRALDHYFVSASAPDIDALDSGRIPGWERTGRSLNVPSFGSMPVCRFHLPPASHFLSASAEECGAVSARHPDAVLETSQAFGAFLPDPVNGTCPPNPWPEEVPAVGSRNALRPVYRLWNRVANHRYTTSREVRDEMIASGWLPEGYGPDGVAFCTLPFLPR